MLSDVAVKRPVLAAVAAIALCVVGLASFFALPSGWAAAPPW